MKFGLDFDENTKFEFAGINDRVIAFVIDYSIFSAIYMAVILMAGNVFGIFANQFPLLIFIGIKIAFETYFGTTPGKKIMQITVLDSEYHSPDLKAVFKRHLYYIIFVFFVILLKIPLLNEDVMAYFTQNYHPKLLRTTFYIIEKVLLYGFAFVDLNWMSKDPVGSNRTLHDRFAGTLVVKLV